jgi:hypothetical protein
MSQAVGIGLQADVRRFEKAHDETIDPIESRSPK